MQYMKANKKVYLKIQFKKKNFANQTIMLKISKFFWKRETLKNEIL